MSNHTLFNVIFLPIILLIGTVTSYEDFKVSKIRNKWVLLGLLYSLAVYLIFGILYYLAVYGWMDAKARWVSSYFIWNFDKWCINLIISTIVSYLLWHFKLWAAGDAKLFICYSALIPMGQYSRVYFNYYFASFLLLLTIFLPATMFLLSKSSIYLIKQFTVKNIKKKLPEFVKKKISENNKSNLIKVAFGFFVFFLFLRIIMQELSNLIGKIVPDQNILMLLILVSFRPLSKIFKSSFKLVNSVFLFILTFTMYKIIVFGKWPIAILGSALLRTVLIVALFPILKRMMTLYAERSIQKTTPFAHWMFLGALITWFMPK